MPLPATDPQAGCKRLIFPKRKEWRRGSRTPVRRFSRGIPECPGIAKRARNSDDGHRRADGRAGRLSAERHDQERGEEEPLTTSSVAHARFALDRAGGGEGQGCQGGRGASRALVTKQAKTLRTSGMWCSVNLRRTAALFPLFSRHDRVERLRRAHAAPLEKGSDGHVSRRGDAERPGGTVGHREHDLQGAVAREPGAQVASGASCPRDGRHPRLTRPRRGPTANACAPSGCCSRWSPSSRWPASRRRMRPR